MFRPFSNPELRYVSFDRDGDTEANQIRPLFKIHIVLLFFISLVSPLLVSSPSGTLSIACHTTAAGINPFILSLIMANACMDVDTLPFPQISALLSGCADCVPSPHCAQITCALGVKAIALTAARASFVIFGGGVVSLGNQEIPHPRTLPRGDHWHRSSPVAAHLHKRVSCEAHYGGWLDYRGRR